ncbi:hypothetical protein IJJ12_02975 [bacterium]|nr:hypothetical protein [bacterium]
MSAENFVPVSAAAEARPVATPETHETSPVLLSGEQLNFELRVGDVATYSPAEWSTYTPAEQAHLLRTASIWKFSRLTAADMAPANRELYQRKLTDQADYLAAAWHSSHYALESALDQTAPAARRLSRALVENTDLSALSDESLGLLMDDDLADYPQFMAQLRQRIDAGATVADSLIKDLRFTPDAVTAQQNYPQLTTALPADVRQHWQANFALHESDLPTAALTNPYLVRARATLATMKYAGQLDAKSWRAITKITDGHHESAVDFDYRLFATDILSTWGESYVATMAYHRELSDQFMFLHDHRPELYQLLHRLTTASQAVTSAENAKAYQEILLRFIFNNQETLSTQDLSSAKPEALLDYIILHASHPETTHDFSNEFYHEKYEAHRAQANQSLAQIEQWCQQLGTTDLRSLNSEQYTLVQTMRSQFSESVLGASAPDMDAFTTGYLVAREILSENANFKSHLTTEKLAQIRAVYEAATHLHQSVVDLNSLRRLAEIMNEGYSVTPREMLDVKKTLYEYCTDSYAQKMTQTAVALANATAKPHKFTFQNQEYSVPVYDLKDNPQLIKALGLLVYNNNTGFNGQSRDFSRVNYRYDWDQADPYAYHYLSTSYMDSKRLAHVPATEPGAVLYGFVHGQIAMLGTGNLYSEGRAYAGGSRHNEPTQNLTAEQMPTFSKKYNEVVLERPNLKPDYLIYIEGENPHGDQDVYRAAEHWAIAGEPLPIIRINPAQLQRRSAGGYV